MRAKKWSSATTAANTTHLTRFSPRRKDGRPEPPFDSQTGVVNPEVERAWETYDIAQVLRQNAKRLRPLLQGKIHLTVGTADTFHLDEPARLLEATMKELGIQATFTFLPGQDPLRPLQRWP